MSLYLNDGDNVVCSGYQKASREGKLIVGLFQNMTIVRRAITLISAEGHPLTELMNYTHLPYEVPRKCEFSQTLAAKAVECHVGAGKWQSDGEIPSPPLMERLTEVS